MTTSMVATAQSSRSRFSGGLLRGLRDRRTVFGLILVVLVLGVGLAAPLLPLPSPNAQQFDAFLPPGAGHLLGTDEFGRDLLSRVIYGARQDALVGAVAVPIGAIVGTLLGLLSTMSRVLDGVLQRVFDVSLAFSSLVMGVTVATVLGPGMPAVLTTVALVNIPLFGRLTRSAVRSQMTRDYVVAARVVGVKPVTLMLKHLLPNAIDPLIVQAALSLSIAVFIEGGMSFVGIGVRPPDPSLGSLLKTGSSFLGRAPMYAIAPIVTVVALVLGFNLVSDGLSRGLLRR